jgi:neutral ceramidase
VRAVILGLSLGLVLLLGASSPAWAMRCAGCLRAGAATVSLLLPAGAPLAGYGTFARRLLMPDILGLYPYAFWFKPSEGTLDPLEARAIVVESGEAKVTWATVDLVGVDRGFTQEVSQRLREAGVAPGSLIISASHTHSGPGAFARSALWAVLSIDRFNATVRSALVGAVVQAITQAEAAKAPARVAAFTREAPDVTTGRLGLPVDREILSLKFVATGDRAVALLWNYAIHGTMLGPANLRYSGDVMGVVSHILERELGVPVLFVNGAVGDVSPRRHGHGALLEVGAELATVVRDGWRQSREPEEAPITIRAIRVALPAPALSLQNCLGRLLPRVATLPLGWAMPMDAELIAVALGDTAWVVVPGELQSELGQRIKDEARTRVGRGFVAGLSNDYLGYFVTAAAYGAPSYVACASLYGPDAGERLTQAARDLIRELGDGQGGGRR